MICTQCKELRGEEIGLEKVTAPGPPDPRTGDVWEVTFWECPKCEHWEEYDPSDEFVEMDDDSWEE